MVSSIGARISGLGGGYVSIFFFFFFFFRRFYISVPIINNPEIKMDVER